MPERFADVDGPPRPVLDAWKRRCPPRDCNADSGAAEDWRTVILNAADRATGCFRGLAARGGTLVPFAILFTEGWWIKADSSGSLTIFDAWNGRERFTFWMNSSSVTDLLARIDLEVR